MDQVEVTLEDGDDEDNYDLGSYEDAFTAGTWVLSAAHDTLALIVANTIATKIEGNLVSGHNSAKVLRRISADGEYVDVNGNGRRMLTSSSTSSSGSR